MKAKLVCFKLSKTICILGMIVLMEMGFILVQINELRQYRSFKQMQESMKETKEITKKDTSQISPKNEIANVVKDTNQLKLAEEITNEIKNTTQPKQEKRKQYETMPETVKGYKVIRKNNHSQTKIRYLHFRRNNNEILKSIGYQIIWTNH